MEASGQLHVPANLLSGKEPTELAGVWSSEPVQRTYNTFELAGNRIISRRLSLPYIDAAALAQYHAGYK